MTYILTSLAEPMLPLSAAVTADRTLCTLAGLSQYNVAQLLIVSHLRTVFTKESIGMV